MNVAVPQAGNEELAAPIEDSSVGIFRRVRREYRGDAPVPNVDVAVLQKPPVFTSTIVTLAMRKGCVVAANPVPLRTRIANEITATARLRAKFMVP